MTFRPLVPALAVAALLVACSASSAPGTPPLPDQPAPEGLAVATFAGGCFWCMEGPFEALEGVQSVTSGYIGGQVHEPTYKQVSRGETGHTEAIRVVYDPKRIDYPKLVEVFWHNIDPTVANRQFCDAGTQYRSGIFFHDDAQKAVALQTKAALVARFGTVHTEITPATRFYPAEEYHQDFYKKSTAHYRRYRRGCGRDARLAELWGDAAKH